MSVSRNNYNGFLIAMKNTDNSGVFELFPHELIAKETYQATPLQRTELKAYRDSNNKLHRVTSPNHKTKITFSTIDLSLDDLEKIRKYLNRHIVHTNQRKTAKVKYWDDELFDYREMNAAYLPDITYPVKTISQTDIRYSPITITLIEY